MKPAPTVPCRECPFRRVALNGYLGAATPENFINATLMTEVGMPCHLTVDYEDPNWRTTMETVAHLCRGALILLKNSCKLPRTPEYAKAVMETSADRDSVFANAAEFLSHHKAKIQPQIKRSCGRAAKGTQMKVKDIQAGKTYYCRRGGMAKRTVLAIMAYDANIMDGRVTGSQSYDGELIVQYRTNSAKPRTVYLWLAKFAAWAGAEVGCVKAPRRAAANVQSLPLTDEVQQDASTADGAVAYLVFTTGDDDYRVFTDQSEAVAAALDEVVRAGGGEKWRVYPLYAGSPIIG